MEQGFTPDTKDHGSAVTFWVEGIAEKSFWGTLKTRGRRKLPVEVWRCGRCGFLESYAAGT
jgi:hypothetical protein